MNRHDFEKELIKEWIKAKGSFFLVDKIENLGDLAKVFYDTKDFDWLIRNVRLTEISFNELIGEVNKLLVEWKGEVNNLFVEWKGDVDELLAEWKDETTKLMGDKAV